MFNFLFKGDNILFCAKLYLAVEGVNHNQGGSNILPHTAKMISPLVL